MINTLPELIKRNFLKPEDGSYLEIPPAEFYRGSTYGDMLTARIPDGWTYRDSWSNGYREVYIKADERAIFTYCEGDLDLTIDSTDETFQKRLASAEEFYARC